MKGAKRKQGCRELLDDMSRRGCLLTVFAILLHNEEREKIGVIITQQQRTCKQAQFVKGSAVSDQHLMSC